MPGIATNMKKYLIPILATLLLAGTAYAASILNVYQGGTGFGSARSGEIIMGSSDHVYTFSKLATGSAGQVLTMSAGLPAWVTGASGFNGVGMREGFSAAFTNKSSISFDSGAFNLDTSNADARLFIDYTNGPASRSATQNITGLWTFGNTGSATFAGSVNVTKSITTSKSITAATYNGASLTTCNGTSFLQWASGLFGCNTPTFPSFANKGLAVNTTGGTFSHITSLSFEANSFTFSNTASLGNIKINWGANGVASRSTANTWTALNTFNASPLALQVTGNASISSGLEVSGIASASIFYAGDGSATVPSFTFGSGNHNTGLYRVGTGILGITAGGVQEASISASTELFGVRSSISNGLLVNNTQTPVDIIQFLDLSSYPVLTLTESDLLGIGTFNPHSKLYITDPFSSGGVGSSSFAINSLQTTGQIASISAANLTTGSIFNIHSPNSGFTGNVFQDLTFGGATIASLSATGGLELAGYASVSNNVSIHAPSASSASFTLFGNLDNTQNKWSIVGGGLSGVDYDRLSFQNNGVPLFEISSNSHQIYRQATKPTISCTAGSPTVNAGSTDGRGEFTAGAAATACTVTFTTPWASKPTCWAFADSATGLSFGIQPSTTTVIFSNASIGGVSVAYGCDGYGY